MKSIIFCIAFTFAFDCFASSVCLVSGFAFNYNSLAYIEVTCSNGVATKIILSTHDVQDSDMAAALAKLVDQGYQIVSQHGYTYYTLVKQ